MKRIITIILALIMTFFNAPQKSAEQQHVTAEKKAESAEEKAKLKEGAD